MTRRLAVVNLSNWDGEDYFISVFHQSDKGAGQEVRNLKPGEVLYLNSYPTGVEIKAEESQAGKQLPFYMPNVEVKKDGTGVERKDKQVFPHLDVHWI